MPAQPPFFTPTLRPAIGRSVLAMISFTRAAAASVRLITLKRDTLPFMTFSVSRVQGPVAGLDIARREPTLQGGFFRQAASRPPFSRTQIGPASRSAIAGARAGLVARRALSRAT